MTKIGREDIQIISQHSNWSSKSINQLLKRDIYNDQTAWLKFLRLFFIGLGVCFTTAGILFFFAYNWADLHKFIKMGLIQGLLIVITLVIVFSKIRLDIKQILLTGASMLVGVLFAVFGQVYQTGANAYDFFLSWTLFITLWTLVSNFAPLWLLFIGLVNTTIVLYAQQVAYNWEPIFILTILFVINLLFLTITILGKTFIEEIDPPNWFTNILSLAVVSCSTMGICLGIFDFEPSFYLLLILTIAFYGLGIRYGLEQKRSFYLAIIPFSLIIIISALLLKIADDWSIFFLISIFVIVSVTVLIIQLIKLQKQWNQ